VEFEEKKAEEKKKQNHRKARRKKSDKGSSVAEIDLKLQRLLLDIELGSSSSIHDRSFSSMLISGNCTAATEVYLTNQDTLFDPKSSANCNDDMSRYEVGEREVIDLLSPPPPRQHHTVSKFPQSNCQDIEVIDLCQSETDVSPEHEKKARELRLFLDSIRDDVP
jgi:flap endonuclease GEN